jgi:ABC-type polar amino acid transport system ATPase subunit
VTNVRELAQVTETLKQKLKAKPQELEGMQKGKSSIARVKCLKKIIKNFTET